MTDEAGAAAATTTAAASTTGAAGGAAEAFDWGKVPGIDADTLAYVQTKGFKDPVATISSYRNFEKLQGVPQDRLLKMPGPDAKPEEIAAYQERLGRPKDAKEYEFAKFEAGEHMDEASAQRFDGFLRKNFHELGITGKQGKEFTARWSEFVKQSVAESNKQMEQRSAAEETELRGEWPDYDKRVNSAKQAVGAFGLSGEDIDALEGAIGFKTTMKFLAAIGSKMGEASFAGGEGGQGGYNAESARSEIGRLKQDPGFAKRLVDGDADAKREWDRLHVIAYPSQAA